MEEKEILSVKEMGQSKEFQYSPKNGYTKINENIVSDNTAKKEVENIEAETIKPIIFNKPKKKSRKKKDAVGKNSI